MIVVDSVGWIEFFSAGKLADQYGPHLSKPQEVLTPTIVLFEVYKKIKRDRSEHDALVAAAQMSKTNIVALDDTLSILAADLGLEHGLPLADSVVYATAVANKAAVVTNDAHFKGLPAVVFVD